MSSKVKVRATRITNRAVESGEYIPGVNEPRRTRQSNEIIRATAAVRERRLAAAELEYVRLLNTLVEREVSGAGGISESEAERMDALITHLGLSEQRAGADLQAMREYIGAKARMAAFTDEERQQREALSQELAAVVKKDRDWQRFGFQQAKADVLKRRLPLDLKHERARDAEHDLKQLLDHDRRFNTLVALLGHAPGESSAIKEQRAT
jgi:hypothetical protein